MRIWEKNAVHPDFISVGCFPVKRTSPDKMIAGKRTFQDFFREQLFIDRMIMDQYHLQGVNRFNCKEFYKKDLLHMTEEGYRRIGPVQAAFLANGR